MEWLSISKLQSKIRLASQRIVRTPPTYQEPRLRNYGGDGWASKLRLVIDDSTGVVTYFRLTLTDPLGQNFGSGGPQCDQREGNFLLQRVLTVRFAKWARILFLLN